MSVASRRPPEASAHLARGIGPTVVPRTLQDAIASETIFLAAPFWEHREVAKLPTNWRGKTIIDATNAFGVLVEELDGQPSSAVVAKAFADASLVKGLRSERERRRPRRVLAWGKPIFKDLVKFQ